MRSSDSGTQMAFGVVTALFFMWGFLTCMNDILIPHLKGVFDLSYAQAMMVQFCFFSAYFLVSLPAGKIVEKLGYKRGMIAGLLVAAFGTLLFQPAAIFLSFPIFLTGFFILAAGITVLQVAANPYVAVLGPARTASSRLNLSQAFNSLGTTIAPLFGSFLILGATTGAMTALEKAQSIRLPYFLLSFALIALAGAIALFKLPAIQEAETALGSTAADKKSAWAFPQLTWGALGIFTYVGGEVAIGSFLVNYLGESSIAGLDHASAGNYVAFYWGGAMVGRFIGSWVMTRVAPAKVLAFNATAAVALLVLTMASGGAVAMWAVLAIGLFNSVMFPTIFTLAIEGLGTHTAQGSGILCAAIVGGAVVPLLQGLLTDSVGLQQGFLVPLVCYLYIIGYGVWMTKRLVRSSRH